MIWIRSAKQFHARDLGDRAMRHCLRAWQSASLRRSLVLALSSRIARATQLAPAAISQLARPGDCDDGKGHRHRRRGMRGAASVLRTVRHMSTTLQRASRILSLLRRSSLCLPAVALAVNACGGASSDATSGASDITSLQPPDAGASSTPAAMIAGDQPHFVLQGLTPNKRYTVAGLRGHNAPTLASSTVLFSTIQIAADDTGT